MDWWEGLNNGLMGGAEWISGRGWVMEPSSM